MNAGRIFREEGERREAAALISRAKPPRPWTDMLTTWSDLLVGLCAVLGPGSPLQESGGEPLAGLAPSARWLRVWQMMWSLPPCSEARKAAFTMGAAALMIERWRTAPTCHHIPAHEPDPEPIGQRAESLLRIAAWHIDDARGEAHARTMGHEPVIPHHERIYERDADSAVFIGQRGVALGLPWTAAILARAIIVDHAEHWPPAPTGTMVARETDIARRTNQHRILSAEHMFAELAVASLPDGPWVMTTRDVDRFIELILEAP